MYEEYRVGAITMTDRTNYIDRQTAYEALTAYYHHSTETQHNALREALNKVPSADVQPVRHGRWIEEPNCMYRCSSCGSHYPSIRGYMYYCYCPYCGARMDGEQHE